MVYANAGLGKIGSFISLCLLTTAMPWPAAIRAQSAQSTPRPSVVARYILAIQKRDFKTVIELTYSYQQEVAKIKANNPQVLWPKLIGEYQQSKVSTLSQQAGYWQNYGEGIAAMTGDPTQTIRALQGLIPASCKWKITESRTDLVQDSIAFGRYQRTRVYVTVDYPSPSDSPIVDQNLLKETILEFTLNAKTQFIMAVSRLSKADLYWTGNPEVRIAMAKRFLGAGLWDAAISQVQPLETQNQLSPDGQEVLASAYFQRVLHKCFATGSNPNAPGYPKTTWFSGDEKCLEDTRQAVRLKPSVGKEWANVLLAISKQDLQASDPENAASLVKMASQFTAGNADLETRVTSAREAVGQYYLAMADQLVKGWGFSKAEPSLKSAIEMWPDESRRRALEMAKGYISWCLEDKYRSGAAFDVLGSMKNLGLRIPAGEVPEFMQFAQRLPEEIYAGPRNPPAEWRKRVSELAGMAGASAAAPPVGVGATGRGGGAIIRTARESRWHGTIVGISEDTSSLDVRRGTDERRVYYDSSTKWTKGSGPADPSEFKEGSDVICLGSYDEKGEFHATRIDLRR